MGSTDDDATRAKILVRARLLGREFTNETAAAAR
jgi:hypothetical protein